MARKGRADTLKIMTRSRLILAGIGILFLAWPGACQKVDYKMDIGCEGETARLKRCPKGHGIQITTAEFGRKKKIFCPNTANSTRTCGVKDVRERVSAICDGRNTCEFSTKTSLLGQVKGCTYIAKYVLVYYICVSNNVEEQCPSITDNNENPVVVADNDRDSHTQYSVKANNTSFALHQPGFLVLIMAFIVTTVHSLN